MPTPAADAEAVDHGEQRLAERGQRLRSGRRDAPVLLFIGRVAPAVLELGDVGAGHEGGVARPAQDDHPDRAVGGEVAHVLGHALPHLLAHRVALVRLVEGDPADRPVLFHQQRLGLARHGLAHGRSLLVSGCRSPTGVSRPPVSRKCGIPRCGILDGRTPDHEPPEPSRRVPGLPLGGERPGHGLHRGRARESRPRDRGPPRRLRPPRAAVVRQARGGPDLHVRRAGPADRPVRERAPGARRRPRRPGRGLPAPHSRDADRDDRGVEGGRGLRADLHRLRARRHRVPGAPQRGPGARHAGGASRAASRAASGWGHGHHGGRAAPRATWTSGGSCTGSRTWPD